jgi:hypothetical protein
MSVLQHALHLRETFVIKFLVVLVAASQQLYQAQTQTFGCNSGEDFGKLQEARSDERTFQALLNQRLIDGECVVFSKGSVVEGSIDDLNSSVLHVQAHVDPPGYVAPLNDFKLKDEKEKSQ